MSSSEWILELILIGLLAVTLFYAVRLERALGILKRDRVSLERLVESFNTSTHQADAGVTRLRAAVDVAGRQVARQIESAHAARDDLRFIADRAERLADRLDDLVSSRRPRDETQKPIDPEPSPALRSQAERDLLKALRLG